MSIPVLEAQGDGRTVRWWGAAFCRSGEPLRSVREDSALSVEAASARIPHTGHGLLVLHARAAPRSRRDRNMFTLRNARSTVDQRTSFTMGLRRMSIACWAENVRSGILGNCWNGLRLLLSQIIAMSRRLNGCTASLRRRLPQTSCPRSQQD